MYDYYALPWFIISCVTVRCMYICIDYNLRKNSRKYISLPEFRQMYIQKNFIKSIILAVLTLYALFAVILPIVRYNEWDTYRIHRLACIYVSNDFTGLVCVNKLPQTTRIHHLITTILVFCSLSIDFQTSEIGKAMLVYTMASASAYIVNFHLAVRWLWPQHSLRWLRYTAGFIYVTACIMSWTWHIWWIYNVSFINIYHTMYFLLLGWIVRDDIILMQWLTRE